ncbi:acyltransferase family protein [Flavobacterium capsici]|uniref:Acyltransferase n=1 Tax=Flavobacterium capsici TaxID=3075618 RepID=A0AA96F4X6_9FLAO|nr:MULTISPECIES: acyltransferase [unclassified Flavobacterium]WNM20221.1 acyltransferase [Flavobacterium sp. PMR2A8]WNM21611.1 acyltransferase [Flavobacterium sp. PMTSA4]
MSDKPIYFSGLNGLRAIAAIAVVISHTTVALKSFNLNPYILGVSNFGKPMVLSLAPYGVSMFFCLSGFLITYLLLAEKKVSSISIKKFYMRRLLRIWPLYYLYIFIVILVMIIYGLSVDINSLLFYMFFSANIVAFFRPGLLLLTHYWSLGVEEQFYLFWPWIIKKLDKYLVIFCATSIIFLIGLKLCLHVFFSNSILERFLHITRFQSMIIGGLGAILFFKKNNYFLKLFNNKIIQSLAWLVILLSAVNSFHIASVIDQEIISFVALILIIGQIKITNRIINLENKFFDYLGKISYGIYIIHPLLIFLLSKFIFFKNKLIINYFIIYFLVLLLTIIISDLSFRYFEKFFMNLKKKFVIVNSSSSKP